MPKFLHLLLDTEKLREDEYIFTLDHDGGLVVSMDAVEESGAFEAQLAGLHMLYELMDSDAEHPIMEDRDSPNLDESGVFAR